MSDDKLRAAADRYKRLHAGAEKSQDIYGIAVGPARADVHDAARKIKRMMLDDERALIEYAVARLAECPTDDGEPVTADWLRAVGFEMAENPVWLWRKSPSGVLAVAVRVASGEFQITDPTQDYDSVMVRGVGTRGQVRGLAAALGIPLAEN
jgi:hypothetical protein